MTRNVVTRDERRVTDMSIVQGCNIFLSDTNPAKHKPINKCRFMPTVFALCSYLPRTIERLIIDRLALAGT